MTIADVFEVGEIMESDEKSSSIQVLSEDDCIITSKSLNKNKIILHMVREADNSEGNVFVRLKEAYAKDFPTSRKLLGSKKIIGLTLREFKKLNIEEL